MVLADHVCSRKLAEKLKLLNVPQKSLFYYTEHGLIYRFETTFCNNICNYKHVEISAFTLSELFYMLEEYSVEIEKDKVWTVWHHEFNRNIARADNLIETLAKALIFIYEDKLKNNNLMSNVISFKRK